MKLIVYGAGAIGGLAGGLMAAAGREVILVVRGHHAAAIADGGLTIVSAEGDKTVPVPVVTEAAAAGIAPGDVVLLAVKSHQTRLALDQLSAVAPAATPVVCVQNGVANERAALRRFHHVYGVCVMCPAGHLEPGVVQQDSVPVPGLLDVGRYPAGVDDTAEALAGAFRAGGFDSLVRPDVMRWKYRKLIMNLANTVHALCHSPGTAALARAAQTEGEAVLAAAGIDVASSEEDRARRGETLQIREIPGRPRGGSSWQSLQRATGDIESDYLNGEVGLLGRLHGIATPVNDVLQVLATRAARERAGPGGYTGEEVLALAGRSA